MSTQDNTPVQQDRFLRWPLVWGLAVFGFICFIAIWPVSEFAFSIAVVLWAPVFAIMVALVLIATLWTALRSAISGRWRRAVSAVSFILLLVLAIPGSIITMFVGNELHFVILRSWYAAQVEKQDADKGGRLAFLTGAATP